jgi:hypothetical protein
MIKIEGIRGGYDLNLDELLAQASSSTRAGILEEIRDRCSRYVYQ